MFETEAPRYWAQGISVMPVAGKKPVVLDWTHWSKTLPDENTQLAWTGRYAGLGIGLIAGQQSRIVGIDIDTDDETLINEIRSVLPPSPWERRGRRGMMLAYKYRGERTFSLKDAEKREIVACISDGKQFVLPPSIHPDTGKPYVANCELLDVLDQLRDLPDGIEHILQEVLKARGIETVKGSGKVVVTKWVSAGGRDNEITRTAGALSFEIVKGNVTLLQAIDLMTAKVESFTEVVSGDVFTVEMGVEKLVRMLRKDVFEGHKTLPKGWDEGVSDDIKKGLGIDDFGDSARRFDLEEIIEAFKSDVTRSGVLENNVETIRVVEKALVKIANNGDLTAVEEQAALSFISSQAPNRVTIASMRKRIGELRRGEILGESHSEAAEVVKIDLQKYGEVRYHESAFWQWRGDHWAVLSPIDIMKKILDLCVGMPAVKKQGDYSGVFKTLAQLCAGTLKAEQTVAGVNFANGFLNEELRLIPHSPDHGCNYVLPYPYDPARATECVNFMTMLKTYWGQDEDFEDKVEALQQAMAATIFGLGPRYQRVFCLKGVPNSGKTRILKLMQALMPPGTTCTVPPEKFAEKFESTDLAGKLLNVAGELDGKNRIPGKIFKMVVEGSEMQGQLKGQQVFTYTPKAAHWFGSNHFPRVDSPDGGFERRWLFFKFGRALKSTDVVPDIENQVVMEEPDAFMAWVVAGLPKLKAQGHYTMPASHFEVSSDMMRTNDSVRFFIEHLRQTKSVRMGVLETQATTPVEQVLFRYQVFCRSVASAQPVGLMTFIERMEEIGQSLNFEPIREVGMGVVGFQYFTIVGERAA